MPAPFRIAWRTCGGEGFCLVAEQPSADKIAQNARIFDFCLAGFYARRCKWWLGKMMHFVVLSGVPHFGCKTPEFCIWLAREAADILGYSMFLAAQKSVGFCHGLRTNR